MNLADFQQEIVDLIYDDLVANDDNKGIILYGDIGSGKSTIAHGVANRLLEGWTIYFIEGIDPNLSPYLTWHLGTKLYSKRKLALGSEISFGINFQPSLISLEFGTSISTSSTNYILTPSEEAIISSIEKQADANRKILFIADNFEMWDTPSKQLLQKIMHPQLGVLSGFQISTLVVALHKDLPEFHIPWNSIGIPEIPDESMLHILRENGYAGKISIRDIRACSGNDLSLALMAADYYSGCGKIANNFSEIMDRRCACLPPEEQELRKMLGPLSIIDSYFSKDEAAFFLDPSATDKYEIEYLAEEYLNSAESQMFIKGNVNYLFSSERIKNYFKAKLAKRERYYHRKFTEFLQQNHPEDYYSRGKHLMLSLQSADSKIIIEAWQMYLLAYFRRCMETGSDNDVYNIFREIDQLIMRLPSSIASAQKYVFDEFALGYHEFTKYNYREALLHFQAITPSRLTPVCLAECQRLVLLCHIQLAENRQMIVNSADELYSLIESISPQEDEQYCRAALVLLDAYIDRSNDQPKVSTLKKALVHKIQYHIGNPAFDEFEACYNRKSALYYSAMVAYQQTDQSIKFYKKRCNRLGTYMALCNHSGNAIISGEYSAAKTAIEECFSIIDNSGGVYYPSKYKIENNQILLEYLIAESIAHGDNPKTRLAANEAITKFLRIIGHQNDEVSYVVLFNYLGLSILFQTETWETELAEANRMLPELDEFYQFYLHDLNYACALLKGNLAEAEKTLAILMSLDAPLLRLYQPILKKRQLTQAELLKHPEKVNGDPLEYDKIIRIACDRVQDNSFRFWGRGFLLSDLQFLSF